MCPRLGAQAKHTPPLSSWRAGCKPGLGVRPRCPHGGRSGLFRLLQIVMSAQSWFPQCLAPAGWRCNSGAPNFQFFVAKSIGLYHNIGPGRNTSPAKICIFLYSFFKILKKINFNFGFCDLKKQYCNLQQ